MQYIDEIDIETVMTSAISNRIKSRNIDWHEIIEMAQGCIKEREEYEANLGYFLEGYRCPRCGCTLLINKHNDVWCSYIYCTYGLKESDVKLIDGKLVELR